MKLNFSRSIGRFWAKSLPLLTGLLLSPLAVMGQTAPIYTTPGTIIYYPDYSGNTVSSPPQIDATTFYNSYSWNIYTYAPYTTDHTLNYTNKGSMIGQVGWRFDYGPLPPPGGGRSMDYPPFSVPMSANFFNALGATIQAADSDIYNPHNYGGGYSSVPVSYLWVSATNIVNKGTLKASANGELKLIGGNIDLSRGELNITPLPNLSGGGYNSGTNFTPDTAVYSIYWAQTNMPATLPANNVYGQLILPMMDSSALWDGTNVSVPTYGVQNPTSQNNCSTDYFTGPVLSFQPTTNDSMSTILSTNGWKQAVFVLCNPDITAQIRFTPSSNPSNYLQTAVVQLMAASINALSMSLQTNAIYIVDTLGSETNRGLNINTNYDPFYYCSGPVYRPANYNVSRTDPLLPRTGRYAFATGHSGSGTPTNNFFYDTSFINSSVSNTYSAYSAFIDNLATESAELVGTTNLPGRIHICANNLDLTKSRISAQGDIWIQASNLVGSTGAVVDCQNLSFDLGSTNGYLNITNLAQQNVNRLRGTIDLWSALWTNTQVLGSTNTIAFCVLVVDASQLSNSVSVTVQDLILNSTNIVVSDSMTVTNSLLFNGPALTLLTNLTLSTAVQNWTAATAPNLRYFTNNGDLYIANGAHFGDDTAMPYTEFVNNGAIVSAGQTIDSHDIQINYGFNYTLDDDFSATAGSIEITGPPPSSAIYQLFLFLFNQFGYALFNSPVFDALLNSSTIYSAGDINLSGNTLLIDPAVLYANGALNFTVTTNLSDNGAANSFTCSGFNLWIKPTNGDLLGTTIEDIASGDYAEVDHAWAGADRGTNWAGFSNNVAIGTLTLSPQDYHTGLEPLFYFYGTNALGTNGMYVVTLDLSQLTSAADVTDMIQIAPNLKIYYSQLILGFTPPNGWTPQQFMTTNFPGSIIPLPNIVVTQSCSVGWWTNVYQRIDGFGASSAWQHTWTRAQGDMFFSTNSGIGTNSYGGTNFSYTGIALSLLRNHIAPANSTSASNTPTTVETNMMLMAQACGAQVWSAPWTPASGFKDTNSPNGGNFVGNPANYQAYASQLANYVVSMKNTWGITIYAISIQNEPDFSGSYESCKWTAQQFSDFVPYLRSALVASNVASTKIMLPEDEFWETNYYTVAMSDPAVATNVDIIANHNYWNSGRPAAPLPLFSNTNAAVWETEVMTSGAFDGSIADGVYWAARIHAFMTVAQANAWHYWWLRTQNSDNEGLTDFNGVPAKRMYTLGNFSRFVRPGYYRVGITNNGSALLVSAYEETNSLNFAIVAINTNINIDVQQIFNLANFHATNGFVTPWITSSAYSLTNLPSVTVTNFSFTYTIPAQSVVTFVGRITNNVIDPNPNIIFPASTPASTPASLQIANSNGQISLVVNGQAGLAYTVLTSTNLKDWQPLFTTNPLVMPLTRLVTNNAGPVRFYRLQ